MQRDPRAEAETAATRWFDEPADTTTTALEPVEWALAALVGLLAGVALVGALTLRERSAGLTLACAVAGGGLAALHQVWEGRHS